MAERVIVALPRLGCLAGGADVLMRRFPVFVRRSVADAVALNRAEEQIRRLEPRIRERDGGRLPDHDEQVVALLDTGEATLKRFYKESGGKVRLQPANKAMEPRVVDADKCRVQGVVIGVLRSYN